MDRQVGIERDRAGLETALAAIEAAQAGSPWADPAEEYFACRDRHIHQLAGAIARSALARQASIGVHSRRDTFATEAEARQSGRRATTPEIS